MLKIELHVPLQNAISMLIYCALYLLINELHNLGDGRKYLIKRFFLINNKKN
jgi:hypothetical protein